MLFFICSSLIGTIQKTKDEHEGIITLKPVVTIMRDLPEYLNVFLGLEQSSSGSMNLRQLDEQISGAVRTLDRELRYYRTAGRNIPDVLTDWELLKRIDKDDEELYQKYLDFANSMSVLINQIGIYSRLSLVSDINIYYFVASTLSNIPEASMRLISTGNLLRHNLHDAPNIIARWNNELHDAQTQGRRLAARPFDRNPHDITLAMLTAADIQQIRNSNLFILSDIDRVSAILESAMDESGKEAEEYAELRRILERYQRASDALSEQASRFFGFNIQNPLTVGELLNTISILNTELCQLWIETFIHLDARIQQNTAAAQRQLILFLVLAFVSLALALGFVIFITKDINRSVRTLRTLFKALNENDLTLSLKIHSEDEFGELMTGFNGFLNILRSTFGSFKQSAQLVASSVFDISSSSKEITTTANEQSASVSEIVSTMESSKNLSEQIALKTTEVAHLAIETQELSSKGAELREANQAMMDDIRKQNQKIINEIKNLSDMIIRISEAIRIIDSIADQTKLIAFNASLEASSSGEAGARFSVVASEIRRFADNVVESTREIKQKIEEVQGASQILTAEANNGSRQIETGYERMSEQKIVFEHIVDNSQNVATRSQQISNLSKQQELASSQIFTALKEISAGVKQFVIATSSTSKIADNLNGMSEELKRKVEEYRTES